MEDSALTSRLREVIRAADDEPPELTADFVRGWPADALGWLDHTGILKQGTNAEGVICDECEDRCWVIPERRRRKNGEVVLVHSCEKRDDIGYVYFSLEKLSTWRVDFSELAREIAGALTLNGELKVIEKNRFWELGNKPAGNKFRRFYMGRGFHFDDAERLAGIADKYLDSDAFLFVLDRLPSKHVWPDPHGSILQLSDIITVKDGDLTLDAVELDRVMKRATCRIQIDKSRSKMQTM